MVSKQPKLFKSCSLKLISLSFKNRIDRSLLKRLLTFSKDNLVLLVLRVSSRCLIYKVHAAEERRFFEFTTSLPVCQALFSRPQNFCLSSFVLSSAQVVCGELIYITTSPSPCQELFSPFFQFPLSVSSVPATLFEAACIQYHFSP